MLDEGHLENVDLINGRDLVEYFDEDDLINKIDYYLNHDKKRNRIAENGYKIVREKYTSDAIVKILLRKIACHLQKKN